jgi:WD40 repeat protein
LSVSPDNNLIVSGGDDKCVTLWDINRQTQITKFCEHLKSINCIKWNPDGNVFASSSKDHYIKLYDIRCNKSIKNIYAHSNAVTSISFHPSKQYLASCSLDSTIKIWDLFNNSLLYSLYGHEGPIYSISFNKNGEFICSGGTDTDLLLWRNNLDTKLIPNNIQIKGGQAYPESKEIYKNGTKIKKKCHLRSKSSFKVSSIKNVECQNINIVSNIPNDNDNLMSKNRNSQNNRINMGIISTNIDSKGIKNNNFNFSNETSKNLENIKTKLNFTSKVILNMSQRMNILGKKIIDLFNQPKNGYKNNFISFRNQ